MATDDAGGANERRISFDLIKSNYFRVIHVEGVIGGVSPHGILRMAFFNERFPIPRHMEYAIEANGTLGEEFRSARDGRDAVIREVECELVMTEESATAFHSWLTGKLKDFERVSAMRAATQSAEPSVEAQPDSPKQEA